MESGRLKEYYRNKQKKDGFICGSEREKVREGVESDGTKGNGVFDGSQVC